MRWWVRIFLIVTVHPFEQKISTNVGKRSWLRCIEFNSKVLRLMQQHGIVIDTSSQQIWRIAANFMSQKIDSNQFTDLAFNLEERRGSLQRIVIFSFSFFLFFLFWPNRSKILIHTNCKQFVQCTCCFYGKIDESYAWNEIDITNPSQSCIINN